MDALYIQPHPTLEKMIKTAYGWIEVMDPGAQTSHFYLLPTPIICINFVV